MSGHRRKRKDCKPDREREDLIPLVPRYNTFVLLLGMVRPMQVDGVWDRDGLVYNAYLAR